MTTCVNFVVRLPPKPPRMTLVVILCHYLIRRSNFFTIWRSDPDSIFWKMVKNFSSCSTLAVPSPRVKIVQVQYISYFSVCHNLFCISAMEPLKLVVHGLIH